MARTAQGQGFSHGIARSKLVVYLRPHPNAPVCFGVPDQVQTVLRAAEENIDAVFCPQEADFPLLVGPHQGHDD